MHKATVFGHRFHLCYAREMLPQLANAQLPKFVVQIRPTCYLTQLSLVFKTCQGALHVMSENLRLFKFTRL
ncbi:hypothetical protein PTE30175_04872 [Pandoraea terrae]|uniref:Uncharacterized protein n=1 Tax=Pandoraea terrae TaxID=1537710 RepID=A0A5E4Z1P0_9BURK|nr:hypothetical protein PTE30175_04872 [Pandoraea terrae]